MGFATFATGSPDFSCPVLRVVGNFMFCGNFQCRRLGQLRVAVGGEPRLAACLHGLSGDELVVEACVLRANWLGHRWSVVGLAVWIGSCDDSG